MEEKWKHENEAFDAATQHKVNDCFSLVWAVLFCATITHHAQTGLLPPGGRSERESPQEAKYRSLGLMVCQIYCEGEKKTDLELR
jgi:hypothetical protein